MFCNAYTSPSAVNQWVVEPLGYENAAWHPTLHQSISPGGSWAGRRVPGLPQVINCPNGTVEATAKSFLQVQSAAPRDLRDPRPRGSSVPFASGFGQRDRRKRSLES